MCMHAPDWRERYRHDLQRNLPHVPLADDFEAFRAAGRQLMDLHIGYETAEEWPVERLVDGKPDKGDASGTAYRIEARIRWGKHSDGSEDRSVLMVNHRCRLVDIPAEAEAYKISGRSPCSGLSPACASSTTRPPGSWMTPTDGTSGPKSPST